MVGIMKSFLIAAASAGTMPLAEKEIYTEPDPDRPGHYVNFHAFAANIYECRIFRTDPTWAIWAQREAHEKRLEGLSSVRDEYV